MIKEKSIKVKTHSISYYNLDGCNNGDTVEISIDKLTKGSHIKITAICDVCEAEKITMYKTYLKMIKDDDKYYCTKCKNIKTSKSNMIKYGVSNVMQLEKNKDKMYKTNFEKYGNICSLQNDDVKDKAKKTSLEKYGCENPISSDIIKNKKIQTCLNRYGVKNVMNDESIMNKMIDTMFEKYGNYINYEKVKETKLKNGTMISDEMLSKW